MSLALAPVSPPARRLSAVHWTLIAFAYWVLFMARLPQATSPTAGHGVAPNWPREGLRLAAAGLLGASATPLLLALARRFPPAGARRWRNLAIQGLAVATLAPGLILTSCFLAAWIFAGRLAPTLAQVAAQVLADWALLVFGLSLLLSAIQLLPRLIRGQRCGGGAWVEHLTIGERGRLRVIDLTAVDWIESQGNYQALHSGDEVHLFRDTSKGLAAKLDPSRFVRIHRRFLVAADRVREVEPLANGDALVRLSNGVALRQSRQHRDALRARLLGRLAG